MTEGSNDDLAVAITGMAGRFPGASDLGEFWENIRSGHCSVTWLTASGDPSAQGTTHVPAAYLIEGSDRFDAEFFGYSPREAEVLDPQQRIFLECAWSALEDGGLDPSVFDGAVGVWGGSGHNSYLTDHLLGRPDLVATAGAKQLLTSNRADYLTSRVSYKLGLTGPAITVQTACSTSLVAVAQACQALLAFECDAALAGGSAVAPDRHRGYEYQEDGILSADGLTRTLDRAATGTVGGDGVGIVLLKRLEDAVADGDNVHAVIRGSAVNNDGAHRVGFSAPGAETQASVIRQALEAAAVGAHEIQYVELHGTATNLGDSIEIAALRAAFVGVPRASTHLGAVKANIGHLDAAAGIAGLIKTVLALKHREIPPLAHFEQPNDRLGLDSSPFRVPTTVMPWPESAGSRRAGVSSFGLGGTNAHVILEEAPERPHRPAAPARPELLTVSARNKPDLERVARRLQAWLGRTPEIELDDVAMTLHSGRRHLNHRLALIADSAEDARMGLEPDEGRLLEGVRTGAETRPVAYLIGGFGAETPGMAKELYETEPAFRAVIERCVELSKGYGVDIGPALLEGQADTPDHEIHRPLVGYPAVFAFQLALVRLWESHGVSPTAMVGHSLGEYVAAHVSEVFDLPDVLRLVIGRASLLEQHAAGAMLAVPLPESEISDYVGPEVAVAAVNDSHSCVLAGTNMGIDAVALRLDEAGLVSQRLASPYAFHSPLVEGALADYRELVASVQLSVPSIPFVSNLTGTWIAAQEATDPGYWVRHMREPVRFADAVGTLWSVPDVVVLEVGLGQTLTAGAMQHPERLRQANGLVVPSLPGPVAGPDHGARAALLRAAARIWLGGGPLAGFTRTTARRVSAPSYPFAGPRYWVDAAAPDPTATSSIGSRQQSDWFFLPAWQPLAQSESVRGGEWLIFTTDPSWGEELVKRLRDRGDRVSVVRSSRSWRDEEGDYFLDPTEPRHLATLVQQLAATGRVPDRVVFANPRDGFDAVVRWAQACAPWLETRSQRWDIITQSALAPTDRTSIRPERASVAGACRVLGQEFPGLSCVQLDLPEVGTHPVRTADLLLGGLNSPVEHAELTLIDDQWWARTFVPTSAFTSTEARVREGGRYVISGGLGRIGRTLAGALASEGPVRLLLLTRSVPTDAEADLQAIRDSGSVVDVRLVDVGNAKEVDTAIAHFIAEYGGVDGLVHAAGITGPAAHAAVDAIRPGDLPAQHHAKLRGAENLRAALADQELDFAILCSSIASVLGGLEFATYSAANAALDAFASRWWGPGQPWCSVGWEAWDFASGATQPPLGAALRDLALSPTEGAEVFLRLLAGPLSPHVVVSAGSLGERIATWRSPDDAAHVAQAHERPALHTPYVPPLTQNEVLVAEVWCEVLGLECVGVNDSFFELGGTSLLGLQIVHRLRRTCDVSLPLTSIYEGPTVRALAGLVADLEGAPQ